MYPRVYPRLHPAHPPAWESIPYRLIPTPARHPHPPCLACSHAPQHVPQPAGPRIPQRVAVEYEALEDDARGTQGLTQGAHALSGDVVAGEVDEPDGLVQLWERQGVRCWVVTCLWVFRDVAVVVRCASELVIGVKVW